MPTPQTEYRTKAAAASAKSRMKHLEGKRFGRWLVISRFGKSATGKTMWLCKCECKRGTERVVDQGNLLSGISQSCGCYKAERTKQTLTKHGHTKDHATTGTYRSWQAMWNRCTNEHSLVWERYGGRSIMICPEWSSFEQFLLDMGPRPPERSLDRYPDNDGNYEKSNCRWATASEQTLNRRILKNNKTGHTGVSVHLGKNYVARAIINGKRKYLGAYPLSPDGLKAAIEAIEKAKQLARILS